MCGEQQLLMPMPLSPSGSPPRVRGTDFPLAFTEVCIRITPACAGNSADHGGGWRTGWDHPRVCGEQLRIAQTATNEQGSPPRVRGTAMERTEMLADLRITPACAGNSTPKVTGRGQV